MPAKKTPTYLLVGAGGTGSILYPSLLRYLGATHRHRDESAILAVVDGDTLADSNLDRQLYPGTAVGANKAEALVGLHPVPPNLEVIAVAEYLGEDNITRLIQKSDTVLIAVDNYAVRALINDHVKNLDNATVINGGNEDSDGSIQVFVRESGKNVTPPLDHCHPEIAYAETDDRRKLSCQQIADLPGGGQTLVANMMSATLMLNTLRLIHDGDDYRAKHEAFFDLNTMKMRPADNRGIEGWNA
jgi:molybdopterin/thiamine biosynthesis adenylyltransferase